MKRLLLFSAFAALCASAFAETAQWKSGGSGPFDNPSHWKDGKVPGAGWQVRFDYTSDAVVDDDALDLFASFGQVVLNGTSCLLTISNTVDLVLQKGLSWFVSSGLVKKFGTGKLTLNFATSTSMLSIYKGF